MMAQGAASAVPSQNRVLCCVLLGQKYNLCRVGFPARSRL
jgi:hypothetical protein